MLKASWLDVDMSRTITVPSRTSSSPRMSTAETPRALACRICPRRARPPLARIAPTPTGAHTVSEANTLDAGFFADGGDEILRRRFVGHRSLGALHVQGEALDAAAETDARGWAAAQLLDQAVVTPAAEESGLGAFHGRLYLEDGAGVVVEAAHEAVVDTVLDAHGVEVGLDAAPVVVAVVAQAFGGFWSLFTQGSARSPPCSPADAGGCVPGGSCNPGRGGFADFRSRT